MEKGTDLNLRLTFKKFKKVSAQFEILGLRFEI